MCASFADSHPCDGRRLWISISVKKVGSGSGSAQRLCGPATLATSRPKAPDLFRIRLIKCFYFINNLHYNFFLQGPEEEEDTQEQEEDDFAKEFSAAVAQIPVAAAWLSDLRRGGKWAGTREQHTSAQPSSARSGRVPSSYVYGGSGMISIPDPRIGPFINNFEWDKLLL